MFVRGSSSRVVGVVVVLVPLLLMMMNQLLLQMIGLHLERQHVEGELGAGAPVGK